MSPQPALKHYIFCCQHVCLKSRRQCSSAGFIFNCMYRQTQHWCDNQLKSRLNLRWRLVARGVKWATEASCYHPTWSIMGGGGSKWHCWLVVKFIYFRQFCAWQSYRTPAVTYRALLSDVEELWGATRPQTLPAHKPQHYVLSKTISICKNQQVHTLIRLIIAMGLKPVIPRVSTRGLSGHVSSRWAQQNLSNLTYLVGLLTQTYNYSQQQP